MRFVLSLLVLAVLPLAAPAIAPVAAAQGASPCAVDAAPSEKLASAAFGLTRQELDALYGPGNAAQTGWIYQFAGFDLTLADCDLILHIDPDEEFADAEKATGLDAPSCRRTPCWPGAGSSARFRARRRTGTSG